MRLHGPDTRPLIAAIDALTIELIVRHCRAPLVYRLNHHGPNYNLPK